MKKEPRYTRDEQREHMREFERQVRLARAAWRRGEAIVILPFGQYLWLTRRRKKTA